MKWIAVCVVVGLVSACAIEVMSRNESSISLLAYKFQREEAFAMASQHCQAFGNNAVLTLKDRGLYTFECK